MVKALGQRDAGWELVRHYGSSSTAADGGQGEVLMVWAEPKPGVSAFSSKAVKYQFVGAGATGELGRRWETMAMATALGIWDGKREQNWDVLPLIGEPLFKG